MIYAMREKRGDREPEKVASLSPPPLRRCNTDAQQTVGWGERERRLPAFAINQIIFFLPPPLSPTMPPLLFPYNLLLPNSKQSKARERKEEEKSLLVVLPFFCESALSRAWAPAGKSEKGKKRVRDWGKKSGLKGRADTGNASYFSAVLPRVEGEGAKRGGAEEEEGLKGREPTWRRGGGAFPLKGAAKLHQGQLKVSPSPLHGGGDGEECRREKGEKSGCGECPGGSKSPPPPSSFPT